MGQETTDIATLAGGCFWCLEAVYDQVNGVQSVEVPSGETTRCSSTHFGLSTTAHSPVATMHTAPPPQSAVSVQVPSGTQLAGGCPHI